MQNADYKNAKRYSRIRHNLALFEIGFTLIFLLTIQFSGLSHRLASFAGFFSSRQIIIIAIYAICFSIFYNLFIFWLDYFGGFRLEHKFGLSRQGLPSWLKDYLKKILIGGLIYLVVIEVLYLLLRNFPDTWWIWAAVFYLFLSLFIAKVFPIFIIPLFYKLEKLEDEDLKGSLLGIAEKARIKILDIYRLGLGAKTKKANAALAGIGASKRILLSDTLLNNYTPEEIKAVLAHELAHYKHRHIWKLILVNLVTTVLAFLLTYIIFNLFITDILKAAIHNISAFPVLFFLYTSFTILITPLHNIISRYFESQADAEAIKLTEQPEAFISLIEKLTRQNLSDPSPSKIVEIFFYDHPPAIKRIRAAKALRRFARRD